MFALAMAVALATPPPQKGEETYAVHCSNCHGTDLKGTPNGPSLIGVGPASIDFMVRTGRMPLEVPGTEPLPAPPQLQPDEIDALIAYVTTHGAGSSPPIPTVVHSEALARGRVVYDDNCEACHGALGTGAVAGFGWLAPPLQPDNPTQIAEAVRIGPGIMPRFGTKLIADNDLGALVAYVTTFRRSQDAGGYSVESSGPVGEGLVAWIFGVGSCTIVMVLVGETLRTRSHPPRDVPR